MSDERPHECMIICAHGQLIRHCIVRRTVEYWLTAEYTSAKMCMLSHNFGRKLRLNILNSTFIEKKLATTQRCDYGRRSFLHSDFRVIFTWVWNWVTSLSGQTDQRQFSNRLIDWIANISILQLILSSNCFQEVIRLYRPTGNDCSSTSFVTWRISPFSATATQGKKKKWGHGRHNRRPPTHERQDIGQFVFDVAQEIQMQKRGEIFFPFSNDAIARPKKRTSLRHSSWWREISFDRIEQSLTLSRSSDLS